VGRGKVGTGKKIMGEEKSRAKREAPGENVSPQQFLTVKPVLAPDWVQKTFVFFCPTSEQQVSECVSRVLTQSSIRGSFVHHSASLVYRKSKALFMKNLTVNVPRSLGTRRRICHVQVKNHFTGKFVLIERIALHVCNSRVPSDSGKIAVSCLVARGL